MEFALLKKDTSDETADGVMVKDRLRAWWNGDDLAAGPDPPGGNGRKSDWYGYDAADAYGSGASVVADRPWPETRRQLAQEIWAMVSSCSAAPSTSKSW